MKTRMMDYTCGERLAIGYLAIVWIVTMLLAASYPRFEVEALHYLKINYFFFFLFKIS